MARSSADASQTGVFFFLSPTPPSVFVLSLVLLSFLFFLCLREKLITCGLLLLYLSSGYVLFLFFYLRCKKKKR